MFELEQSKSTVMLNKGTILVISKTTKEESLDKNSSYNKNSRYNKNSSSRGYATLSNKFWDENTEDKSGLNMFPEVIVNIFKSRIPRGLTNIEGVNINQPNVVEMLHRVQGLMREADLNYEGGRSGMLETES